MAEPRIARALIVDDSAFVRKTLRQLLEQSPYIEVVGAARDGLEALEMVAELEPDVITLDLIMPHLGGVGFLERLMDWRPTPVVVVSIASEDGEQALAALDAGAVDVVQKPTGLATDRLREIGGELVAKVKAAASTRPPRPRPPEARLVQPIETRPARVELVAVGASTGGPQALRDLISRLPPGLPAAVAVVLHMPVGFTKMYAERLDALTPLEVKEAEEGDAVVPGRVLVAPAGRHLTFERGASGVRAHLDAKPLDTPHRPSADVLFASAARIYGPRALGVVLTGMGADGTVGAREIRAAGGRIIAEAEESCVVFGMPRSVIEAGLADRVAPLSRMPQAILSEIAGESSSEG